MHYRIYLSLTLLVFISIPSFVYSQNDDRVAAIEARIKVLDNLVQTKPYSLQAEIDSLRLESIQLGSVRNTIMANLALSKAFENQKDYAAAYTCIDSAFAIAERNNYDDLDYMLNYRKGFTLIQQGENSEALAYLERAASIAEQKDNEAARAQGLANMGFAYTKIGELEKSITLLDEAGDIYRSINDQHGLQRLHSYMAVYYSRAGDNEKSIAEQQKALDISIAIGDTSSLIVNHTNLLSRYAIIGDVEKAFYHYNERNRIIDLIEYPEDRRIDLNIGVLYIQNEQYDEALEVLNKCQNYYQKEGNAYRVALIDHWMAIAYRGLNRYDLAAQYSQSAFRAADTSGNKKLAELSAYTLFQTYHWRGRDTDAIYWLIKSNEIKDSLNTAEKQKEMLALETKYETFRKEQEIALLKAEAESQRARRNQLWMGLLASILIGALLVYSQIIRRRQEKAIQAEKLRSAMLEQENLEERLHHKEKELATQLLTMAQKNEFLAQVSGSLESMKQDTDNTNKLKLQKLIGTISRDIQSNETWDKFLESFKEIHHTFVEKLMNSYQLTSNEIRLASMLKMNMTSKEIANLLNISSEGIKKARYRLRKKLELSTDENLQEYLMAMS